MSKNICLILLCVFGVIFFYQPLESSDTGWHIATGKWILTHHSVPYEDPFSINPQQPTKWIFTQWLGSTLLAMPYLWGGPEALKIFRDFIFVLTVIIFIFYARHKIPFPLVLGTATLMMYGLGTRCLARSFIFNFIFISIMLIILFSFQKNRSVKQLYILPAIALFWGNIHLGSFVYGVLILTVFLFSTVLRLSHEYHRETDKMVRINLKKLLTHVGLMYVLYFLCVGITPYGVAGFLYPYKVFLIPDYINFYKFTFSVVENMSPSYLLSWSGSWFVGLSVIAIITFIICKKKDLFSLLLFVIAFFFFIAFSRGSDFFTIVCSYIIVDQINSGVIKDKLPTWFSRLQLARWTYVVLILVISMQLIKIANQKAYLNGQERQMFLLNYIPNHPKDSIDFLKSFNITGNIFCNEHTGSYILGAEYPNMKTLVDGRQINQQYFQDYFNVTADPEKYWRGIEKQFQIQIVVLDAAFPISARLMRYLNEENSWQIVNVDNTFVTFIKKGVYRLPKSVDSFENTLITTRATENEHHEIMNLALNEKGQKKFSTISALPQYIDILEEGVTLIELGYSEAAVKKFARALEIDPNMTKKALHIQLTQ